jgi:hypothetical protein
MTSVLLSENSIMRHSIKHKMGSYIFLLMLIFLMASLLTPSLTDGGTKAQKATNTTELVTKLLNDVSSDLQNNDISTALMHLETAKQEIPANSSIGGLIVDVIQDLMASDIDRALLHVGLANQSLSMPSNKILIENRIPAPNTYSSYGVSIQYPSNWQYNASLRPIFDALFLPAEGVKPLPEVGLGIKTIDIPPDIVAANQDINSTYVTIENTAPIYLKSIIPDFLLTDSGMASLSELPAYSMEFIGDIGEGVKAVHTTLLIHEGKLYILSYFAPPHLFADYLQTANRMMESFRIIR